MVLLSGCSENTPQSRNVSTKEAPTVFVSGFPNQAIADELVGDGMVVTRIAPETILSRNWAPSAAEIRPLQKGDLILMQGAGYESWRQRVSLPKSRVRESTGGIYAEFIRVPDLVTHQHGPDGKHSHAGTVWATWLHPELLLSQISETERALVSVSNEPSQAESIQTSAAKMKAAVTSVDDYRKSLMPLNMDTTEIIADSWVYSYMLKSLELSAPYLHWPIPDTLGNVPALTETDSEELRTWAAGVAAGKRRILLLNSLHSAETEQFAHSLGMETVRIDVCEFSSSQTLVERIRGNFERIAEALTQSGSKSESP